MSESKQDLEGQAPQYQELENNDNIVLKMSQIRSNFDNWTIYLGVLFLGLTIAILVNAQMNLYFVITSSFQSFDIGPVVDVVNTLLGILFVPLAAALSDVYGRGLILTIFLIIKVIGSAIVGTAQNFGVYSAGNIIAGLGETGRGLLIPIILADFLSPRNRGFGFILNWVPSCLALGIAIPVITGAQKGDNWRWLYNGQAIFVAITAIPILFGLFRLQRKAQSFSPKFNYQASSLLKVDWIGILLLTSGFGCILIPFTMVIREANGWASPAIFVPIIFGVLILVGFAIWEVKFTKYPLVSYRLLNNRAAIIMVIVRAFLMFDSNLTWQYMTPYLSLSRGINVDHVASINLGYRLTWYILGFATAFILRRFNYIRGIVWVSMALNAIGVGLTLPSRHPHTSEAIVVLVEAIIGAGAGVAACAGLVVLQTTVDFKDIANISALDTLVTNIFSSIASAVGSAVWNTSLRNNLTSQLPESYHSQIASLIADTSKIAALPTDLAESWMTALGNSQWLMCTISTVFACVCFVLTLGLPSIDLDKCQQIMDTANQAEAKEMSDLQ
jgi:MFS family permease